MRRAKTIIRPVKTTFAFLVDGDCEYWYIQLLKRNEQNLKVDLKPEIPQRKELSDLYMKAKELSKDYTKVFWIVDFDVIQKETRETPKGKKTPMQYFKEYYADLRSNYENVIVIINNPCLEYWYLLHFVKTTRHYEKYDSLKPDLRKYLPNYDKSQKYYMQKDDIYKKLKPFLPAAIANAKSTNTFEVNNPCGIAQMHLFYDTEINSKKIIEMLF
ncbi:RloB domain-containing protein [Bacteroides sp. 224]|uniref:RloB domain-containing protein n=1 Tax=Bacteroides sp. 224 TaxID=2302936 RepID=UPI0013D6588C|nr:RloB domain-containing protein [Bacteroides sp. 224]NDV64055.1 RloB domain-containing protein [Bacteroides sp. 224]